MPMAVALMTITGSCIANCGSFQFRHKAVFKSVRGSRNKGEKKIAIALMASSSHVVVPCRHFVMSL